MKNIYIHDFALRPSDSDYNLLCVQPEGVVYIYPSKSAERAGLSADALQVVIDSMAPQLRSAKYGHAVLHALGEMKVLIEETVLEVRGKGPNSNKYSEYGAGSGYDSESGDRKRHNQDENQRILIGAFCALILLASGLSDDMEDELRKLRSAAEKIERIYDVDRLSLELTTTASCPHCLRLYDARNLTQHEINCGRDHVVCVTCAKEVCKGDDPQFSCKLCQSRQQLLSSLSLAPDNRIDKLSNVIYRIDRFYSLHKPYVNAADMELLKIEAVKSTSDGLAAVHFNKVGISRRIRDIKVKLAERREREERRRRQEREEKQDLVERSSSSSSYSPTSSSNDSSDKKSSTRGAGGTW